MWQWKVGITVLRSKPSMANALKTRSDAKCQVFEYIEAYYNRKQLHSKPSYLNPVAFEVNETNKVAWWSVREIGARSASK
jgi:hypothetical protein